MSTEMFESGDDGQLTDHGERVITDMYRDVLNRLANISPDPINDAFPAQVALKQKAQKVLRAYNAGEVAFTFSHDPNAQRFSSTSLSQLFRVPIENFEPPLDSSDEESDTSQVDIQICMNTHPICLQANATREAFLSFIEKDLVFDISVVADFLSGDLARRGYVDTMTNAARLAYTYKNAAAGEGLTFLRRVPDIETTYVLAQELPYELQIIDTTALDFLHALGDEFDERRQKDEDTEALEALLSGEEVNNDLVDELLTMMCDAETVREAYDTLFRQLEIQIILEENLDTSYTSLQLSHTKASERFHQLTLKARHEMAARVFAQIWIHNCLDKFSDFTEDTDTDENL